MPMNTLINKRNSTRGFTLIELLVVMGIIAILAAVSWSALNSAISHARTAKCASNLRNIGAAMIMFAGDNNGNLPESGSIIAYNAKDPVTGQYGWTQQLEPYLGVGSAVENASGGSIFQCPDRNLIPTNKYYSYFNGSHAAQAQLGGFGPVSLIKIRSPSSYIMAGDIAFPGSFSVDDCDKDDYTQDPAFNGYTAAMAAAGTVTSITIHGGSVNLVFADGHVENARSFDNTKMTTVYQGPGTAYDYLYPQ